MNLTEKDDDFKRYLVARFCLYKSKGQDTTESRHHRRCANWICSAYADAIARYDKFKAEEANNG